MHLHCISCKCRRKSIEIQLRRIFHPSFPSPIFFLSSIPFLPLSTSHHSPVTYQITLHYYPQGGRVLNISLLYRQPRPLFVSHLTALWSMSRAHNYNTFWRTRNSVSRHKPLALLGIYMRPTHMGLIRVVFSLVSEAWVSHIISFLLQDKIACWMI